MNGAYLANLSGRGQQVPSLPTLHGVFETILVGRQLRAPYLPLWDLHVDRLVDGIYRTGLELPPNLDRVHEEVRSQLFRIDGELRLKLVVGRDEEHGACVLGLAWGAAPEVERPTDPDAVRLMVRAEEIPPSEPESLLDEDSGLPLGRIKSTDRRAYEMALVAARSEGFQDALLVAPGSEGQPSQVLETTIGNVFARIGGQLVTTPAHGARVPGVGQTAILRELKSSGVDVDRREISLDELRTADAIWVTNALRGPRRASLDGGASQAEMAEDPLREAWSCACR
ncbi:MAG: aminotransferase class IV [Planctomycetota bacterium]